VTALPPQTENPHVRSALRIRPQAVFPTNSIADRQDHQIGIKSCRSFDHLVGARQKAAVLKNFQARIPYGLVVPDVDTAQ
jgi:hypothetical protein